MPRALGAVHTISVTELLRQARDPDVPVVAGTVELRAEGYLSVDLTVTWLREYQIHRGSMP